MQAEIFQKDVRDQRRSLIWWSVGLLIIAAMYVAIFPTIQDAFGDNADIPEDFLQAFGVEGIADLTSPEGYLNVEMLSATGPILFLVFAIARGVGAIAGSERKGELELLLANPIPRSRVLIQRFAALLAATTVLGIILWVGLASGVPLDVWSDLSLGNLAQAIVGLVFIAWVFGAIAICIGAATGNTGLSYAVVGTVAITTYLINGFAQSVGALEPLRWTSPFHYYFGNDPLVNGLVWWHALILLAITAIVFALAVPAFQRRDLKLA